MAAKGKGRRVERRATVDVKATAKPVVLDVAAAAKRLGIGADRAYAAVAAGHIPSFMLGRRRVVPVAALERMINGQSPVPPDEAA